MDHKQFIKQFNEGAYGSARYGAATAIIEGALSQYMETIQAESSEKISDPQALALALKYCVDANKDRKAMDVVRIWDAVDSLINHKNIDKSEFEAHYSRLWDDNDNRNSPSPS